MHHNTIIADDLIKAAKAVGAVKAISVEVGELNPMTIGELEPTLRSLVDWDISMYETPAEVSCSCGYKGSPKILERGHDMCYYECPECAKVPEVLTGKDIILKTVEVVE